VRASGNGGQLAKWSALTPPPKTKNYRGGRRGAEYAESRGRTPEMLPNGAASSLRSPPLRALRGKLWNTRRVATAFGRRAI
jgi:hypothetical protein